MLLAGANSMAVACSAVVVVVAGGSSPERRALSQHSITLSTPTPARHNLQAFRVLHQLAVDCGCLRTMIPQHRRRFQAACPDLVMNHREITRTLAASRPPDPFIREKNFKFGIKTGW
jgi:hypothetical protein